MKPLGGVALLALAVRCAHGEHIDIRSGGSVVSPNKRYEIVVARVEPARMPGSSAVSLRVRDTDKLSVLFHSKAGGRGVDIFWSPDSGHVAINSYEANSGDSLHVFRVHGASATRLRKPSYDATWHFISMEWLSRAQSRIATMPWNFVQVPGFPSAIRVFALTHSHRSVVQCMSWLISVWLGQAMSFHAR